MKNDLDMLKISPEATILQAMEQMDRVGHKLLMVFDGGAFAGLISIGAIQRAIIKGASPKAAIGNFLRTDVVLCTISDSMQKIKAEMLRCRSEYMPIVRRDPNSGITRIVDVVFWEDVFNGRYQEGTNARNYDLPVVVMAGGEGSRLRPLTNVIPKPLLPIGKKTIIEEIMDGFANMGCKRFFISLNYMADTVERYLKEHAEGSYELFFFREDRPMGSGGSLSLIREKIAETFFVTNCDNVLRQNLSDIVDVHRQSKNEMTVVAAIKGMRLPYGNLVVGSDEQVVEVEEKPEFLFRVNTGVYVIEPGLLQEVPDKQYFPITDLMNKVIARNGKVGCFPITDGSWCDIGNWEDYAKIVGRA